MNVFIVGSGGREHAISWKIAQSSVVDKVYLLPGNAGATLTSKVECLNYSNGFEELKKYVDEYSPALVIIGPETLLTEGVVDYLQSMNIKVLGPSKEAAKLEGSKIFSKEFMKEFSIPTANFLSCNNYEEALKTLNSWDLSKGIVIKADGLASGKGVVVTDDKEEAEKTLYDFMENPKCVVKTDRILLEEKLLGKEVSAFAIYDGDTFFELGFVCDYKRVGDNDTGPNTGGMGCYTPKNWPSNDCKQIIRDRVFTPVLEGMKKRGTPFSGILFAGLMVDGDEPSVIEFNVRLGDPETQTLLPLIEGDLLELFTAAADGKLKEFSGQIKIKDETAVHVVIASEGYPSIGDTKMITGKKIENKIDQSDDLNLFFAGVNIDQDENLINSGGRVLGVTAIANTLEEARLKAYKGVNKISFEGAFWRKDIGQNAR